MIITKKRTKIRVFVFRIVLQLFGSVVSDSIRFFWTNLRLEGRLRWPNIKNPKTFNEKILWLKSNHNFSLGTVFADKLAVREYVMSKIGEEVLVPILKVYHKDEEIEVESLPNRFVIKTNHGSGNVEIVTNDSKQDIIKKFNRVRASLSVNYYEYGGEWQYRYIKPTLFIEEFLGGEEKSEINDYKVFCFNGVPRLIQVDIDRFTNHRRNFYDTSWNKLDFSMIYPNFLVDIKQPRQLQKLIDYSRLLAHDIPFIRVDFYVVEDKLYFGELTLHQEGGVGTFSSEEWNYTLGDWIDLSQV